MASDEKKTFNRVFFDKEWYEIIAKTDDKERLEIYDSIMKFMFYGTEITNVSRGAEVALMFVIPMIKRELELSSKRSAARKNKIKQTVTNENNSEQTVTSDNKQEQTRTNGNKNPEDELLKEFVERMYQMYPSKCPVRGTSLGKCSKDKERIRKLLKSYSKEDIEKVFKMEIGNKYGKSYMQNFSTFLNNFPDPKEISEDTAPLQPQKPQQQQPVHRDPNSAEELDEYYKILKQRNIENEEAYERSLAEQRKNEILRYIEERKDDVCILGVGETFQNDYFDLTGLEDGTIKWVCRVANCQRRFYFNRHDDVMISIPLDAPPMPDKMSVYDFESKGWR